MGKIWILLMLTMSLLASCSAAERHLASDVSLLTNNVSTSQDVLAYLGAPDEEHATKDGGSVWVYYQAHNSLLRDVPLVGNRLGQAEYEQVMVTFKDKVVQGAVYRILTEEEYRALRVQ